MKSSRRGRDVGDQCKEGYIKKLEEQVRDLHSLEDNLAFLVDKNVS